MELEKQVVSLDLAKRLKELGVKQDGLFAWLPFGSESGFGLFYDWGASKDEHTSAFTVAELGEMLLDGYSAYRFDYPPGNRKNWVCKPPGAFDEDRVCFGDTEADARAKMLIYLIENGLCQV